MVMIAAQTAPPAPANALSDVELVELYARSADEGAFAELMSRHRGWVYASALRQVGDCSDAEDITQAVFAVLAAKVASLRKETILAGWLFRAARYAAIDLIRAKNRRLERERLAMKDNVTEAESAEWEDVQPVIDDCVGQLRPADHKAILLRFYQQRRWHEVGATLGLKENAARVRVERALGKLRNLLLKCGVRGSAAGLGSFLLVNAGPTASAAEATGRNVAGLTRAIARAFAIQKAAVALVCAVLVSSILVTVESFRRIPLAQDLPQQALIGNEAFRALVEMDRAFWDGDPKALMERIYFPAGKDLQFGTAVRAYLQAAAEFRAAGMARFRNPRFGYYEILDALMAAHERPTHFGREGARATGYFARKHGIFLVRVNGKWRWDFLHGIDESKWAAQIEALLQKRDIMKSLTQQIRDDGTLAERDVSFLRSGI